MAWLQEHGKSGRLCNSFATGFVKRHPKGTLPLASYLTIVIVIAIASPLLPTCSYTNKLQMEEEAYAEENYELDRTPTWHPSCLWMDCPSSIQTIDMFSEELLQRVS